MKNITLILTLLIGLLTNGLAQSSWSPDMAHSSVNFTIEHMGISLVQGRFESFEGEVKTMADDFSDMQVDFTLDATSINTGVNQRDEHIKSPDMLDVAQYPTMHFVSTSVTKTAEDEYDVTGNMTMHGITNIVTLHVVYHGQAIDSYKNVKAGLSVTGIIDRYAFGVEYNMPIDGGKFLIGKTMQFESYLELVKE